ncbi:MAG TPA: ECF-type sigma factor [Solimonas sp.]|jgi:RNA polymerase sigma factor (TIGR02999 family)|nr:ECF-type sigma factor [Solimonas sp.]
MSDITRLLGAAAGGDAVAVRELYAALYPDIRRIARARLAAAGGVTGLNTTALVHEGFLRMADNEGLRGSARVQFFAYVGRALRSVVLDYLRAQGAEKRGGEVQMVTLSHADEVPATAAFGQDLEALDSAITRMQMLDEALSQTVEMHFFAGMTIPEIAAVRDVSTRTVDRELKKARLLLAELLAH